MVKTFAVIEVLLVEQDVKERNTIADVLNLAGYQVTVAASALDLEKLAQQKSRFGLAVFDRMPEPMLKSLTTALGSKRIVVNGGAILLDDLAGLDGHIKLTHRLNKPYTDKKLTLLASMIAPREVD